jgi:hypothetical protein
VFFRFHWLGLIVGAIVLATQLHTSWVVYNVTSEFQAPLLEEQARQRKAEEFLKGMDITGSNEWGTENALQVISDFQNFHPNRSLNVAVYINMSDATNGGPAPDKDLLEAFAQATSAKMADAECAVLLTTQLASKCRVGGSSGQPDKDRMLHIRFNLEFAPKAAFGEIKKAAKGALVENIEKLASDSSHPLKLAAAQAYRVKLYNKAAQFCAKMKTSFGNCAVMSMQIQGSAKGGRAAAHASFARLMPL